MSNFITSWILDLVDNVTAPLQAMQGAADVTADAVNKVQDANKGVEDSAKAATVATTASGKAAGIAAGMFNALKTAALPLLGITAAVSLITGSLKDYDAQAKANAQVMATLESTNYAAGKSFQELADQASALQKKSNFGDELILGAQSIMLTFKEVRGEIYDRSIPAIVDMATHMKMDLKSASLMVGKALNDPVEGVSSLQRAGVKLSDSQKDVVKSLVETGNVAEAQRLILEELESQFGGTAEALSKAGLGPIDQIKMAWGDLREYVGEAIMSILDVITPVIMQITEWLDKIFKFIKQHSEIFRPLALGALGFMTAVKVLTGVVSTLGTVFKMLGITTSLTSKMMTASISSIPIIGWIAAAIAALIALGTYFWNTSAKFRGFLYGLWEAVKTVFSGIGGFIGDTLNAIWDLIKNVFNPKNWFNSDYSITDDLNKIGDIARQYGESIGKAFSEGQQKGFESFEADKAEKEEKKKAGKYPGVLTAADLLSDSGNNGAIKATGGSGSGSDGSQKGLSLSGSGSGGRSITMNVTMTNNFNGKSNDEAMKIVRQLTDRLSDAVAAV